MKKLFIISGKVGCIIIFILYTLKAFGQQACIPITYYQNICSNGQPCYYIDDPVTVTSTCYQFINVEVVGPNGSLSFEGTVNSPIDVWFLPGTYITVSGGGIINGLHATFKPMSYNPPATWGGIRICEGSHLFSDCKFFHSKKDPTYSPTCDIQNSGGALGVTDCYLNLINCEFHFCEAYNSGGAVALTSNSIANIENCGFFSNITSGTHANLDRGGGALAILKGSSATVSNSYFYDNYSEEYGGAVFVRSCKNNPASNQSSALIESNSEFHLNTSQKDGGAIALKHSQINISETSFSKNSSIEGMGGALYSHRNFGQIFIGLSYFEENTSLQNGGAVAIDGSYWDNFIDNDNQIFIKTSGYDGNYTTANNSSGGAIYIGDYLSNHSNPTSGPYLFLKGLVIEDNHIEYNQSSKGGALSINNIENTTHEQSILLIQNNRFKENYSSQFGGAIFIHNIGYEPGEECPEVMFFLNKVENNRSNEHGGGMYLSSAGGFKGINNLIVDNFSNEGFGGGVYAVDSEHLELGSNTIANNEVILDEGGGAYFRNSSYQIFNSIFWSNVPNSITDETGSDYWDYCYYSNIEGIAHQGIGNLDDIPEFVDPTHGDYSLQCDVSPCVDAGDNTYFYTDFDLNTNPRIIDGVIDIGAYECQSFLPRKLKPEIGCDVNVFPNPCNEWVNIVSDDDILLIKVFSLQGTLLHTEFPNAKSRIVCMKELSEGIYLFEIQTISGMYDRKKVVKTL